MVNPPKSILDASFRYTKAVETDLAKTFAKIRREQKAAAEREQANEQEAVSKVAKMRPKNG